MATVPIAVFVLLDDVSSTPPSATACNQEILELHLRATRNGRRNCSELASFARAALCIGFVSALYRLCISFVSALCQLCIGFVSASYRLCIGLSSTFGVDAALAQNLRRLRERRSLIVRLSDRRALALRYVRSLVHLVSYNMLVAHAKVISRH